MSGVSPRSRSGTLKSRNSITAAPGHRSLTKQDRQTADATSDVWEGKGKESRKAEGGRVRWPHDRQGAECHACRGPPRFHIRCGHPSVLVLYASCYFYPSGPIFVT